MGFFAFGWLYWSESYSRSLLRIKHYWDSSTEGVENESRSDRGCCITICGIRGRIYEDDRSRGPGETAEGLLRGLLASEGRRSVEPMAAVLRFQLRPAPQPIGWARALPACGAHRIDEAPQDDPQKRC